MHRGPEKTPGDSTRRLLSGHKSEFFLQQCGKMSTCGRRQARRSRPQAEFHYWSAPGCRSIIVQVAGGRRQAGAGMLRHSFITTNAAQRCPNQAKSGRKGRALTGNCREREDPGPPCAPCSSHCQDHRVLYHTTCSCLCALYRSPWPGSSPGSRWLACSSRRWHGDGQGRSSAAWQQQCAKIRSNGNNYSQLLRKQNRVYRR